MNGYLLDSHVWLWARANSPRLGPQTWARLRSGETQLYLSAATTWEVTIKWRLGKLHLPQRPAELVRDSLENNRLIPLPISHSHAWRVGDLPDHHHDPFDRLLLAQCLSENLELMTADPQLRAYPVSLSWALE